MSAREWRTSEGWAWCQEGSDGYHWNYRVPGDGRVLSWASVRWEKNPAVWSVTVWDDVADEWMHEGLARTLEEAMRLAIEAIMQQELAR